MINVKIILYVFNFVFLDLLFKKILYTYLYNKFILLIDKTRILINARIY